MILSRPARWLLGLAMALGLAFVYVPLAVVVINSFNTSRALPVAAARLHHQWWRAAVENEGVREALPPRSWSRWWPRRSRWCSAP